MAQHWISRAHCYVAEISSENVNVMMEMGYAYWGYQERPLLLLRRSGYERKLADLSGYIPVTYPWPTVEGVEPNVEAIVKVLRDEIGMRDDLRQLKDSARYLSKLSLPSDWLTWEIREEICMNYDTIETFISEEPKSIARRIHGIGPGGAADIQRHLREMIGLHE